MTKTSLCYFIISYVCIIVKLIFVILAMLKNEEMIITRERLALCTRELEMLFFPQNKALHHLSFICTRPRGVLSSSVFITRRWLLNLQNCSLCSHPGPASTSICGLACEDLLPWWRRGSMWRGDVLSYRARLISQLSSQGSAEGQLHNRMIHHAGLTHLSHV